MQRANDLVFVSANLHMLCKGMTKRADPFTAWEEAQANLEVTEQHTLEILEELERVPEIEVQEEEDFTETGNSATPKHPTFSFVIG